MAYKKKALTLKGGARHPILMLYARIISPKHGNTLNTRSNDFIRGYIERVMSRKQENRFGSRCDR